MNERLQAIIERVKEKRAAAKVENKVATTKKLSKEEVLDKLAAIRSRKAKKEAAVNSEKSAKIERQEKIAAIKNRIALRKKLADKIAARKANVAKKAEIGSVIDGAESSIGNANLSTKDKNYAVKVPAPGIATGADMASLKKKQLQKAPPTLLAEDVRNAYKKAVKLAFVRTNKNLEETGHPIKEALYDRLVGSGIATTAAVKIANEVFDGSVVESFMTSLFKRADEIADYSEDTINELEKDVQLVCQVVPVEDMQVEAKESVEEQVEDAIDTAENEEEAEIEEIESRIVEGSIRVPKVASQRTERNLIAEALPRYGSVR